ncbi:MAG TPA: hypothetical protein VFO30_00655 [Chthoniobacterales bacterium]|nr:hypothetical protein [Chthoniobacterales bacterium]
MTPRAARTLIVLSIFVIEALLVYFLVARRFPFSGDDYSYLYQARLFASGRIYAEDPFYDPKLPFYDCIQTYCLRDNRGHRFSKYPPGWPALLGLGARVRAAWLVDPILGALLLLLVINHAERRWGEHFATNTSLLLLLCFFFVYYAASFRAHIATALFIFAAFLVYDANERRAARSKLWLFLSGALLGYSAMIRYIDWIPLALWNGSHLVRRNRFVDLGVFALGFSILASGNLLYDALLFGDPLQAPATMYHFSAGINDHLFLSWRSFTVTAARLGRLLLVFPPLLLLITALRNVQVWAEAKTYLGLFLLSVATYFFYPEAVGGPGPRYFLGYFPFLVLAVVAVYRRMVEQATRLARPLWNAALLTLVLCNAVFIAKASYVMHGRRDLERTAEQLSDRNKKIIFLKTGTYDTPVGDLTRNPPVLSSARTLYFKWCDQSDVAALLQRFAGRSVYVYEYPGRLQRYNRR